MLGKLLKHEFKATGRLFIPLYITILLFSIINKFLLPIYDMNNVSSPVYKIAAAISMFAYITLMVGMVLMTLVVMIQRFYKSLLGDEGYLMFTLPVHPWMHIVSKLVISMFWAVISIFVAIGSVLLTFSANIFTPEFYNGWAEMSRELERVLGGYRPLVGIESIIIILLSIASTILLVYASIALGHLFNKHKLIISFGMYVILRTVSQIIIIPFMLLFSVKTAPWMEANSMPGPGFISSFLLIIMLYFLIITAGYYVLTNYILKKRLNLE